MSSPTADDELTVQLAKPRFPRASKYDARWILDHMMGPHVLWLAEYLAEALPLRPGMRVLDLGCGKAVSSIFFAREFGVRITAADLWISPDENRERIAAAGLASEVTPVRAEAHALPFEDGEFDAIVSLDAYHYFGTGDLYLGSMTRLLRSGGRIGIVVPGFALELSEVPAHLAPWWEWELWSLHSPAWWRHHWAKTRLVAVETADWMPGGHDLWLEWCQIAASRLPVARAGAWAQEAAMLEADTGKLFGFTRTVARKA